MLVGKIMPALVWRGGADCLWPINSDKASVAVAGAVIAAISGIYPNFSAGFFDATGGKTYFDTIYLALQEVLAKNECEANFAKTVLYLFEPRKVGDIRDPGISTAFAERWMSSGHRYADYAYGDDCHVRRRILDWGKEAYWGLSLDIQDVIDKVAPHIPPMLKKVLES